MRRRRRSTSSAPDTWAEHEVGVERVRVDALADVLSEAGERAGGARTIGKVNIEGEECSTILGTPASAWADVAEVYIETHPWAACGAAELTEHLKNQKKDHAARRGLTLMVGKRNRLLKYLHQADADGYHGLIKKLGLRK